MSTLPLPHRYDRYRIIALVLGHRKNDFPDLSQIKLEDLTHLDQSTISRLLNPNFLGEKGKQNRKLNRTHLLALTRVGLQMDHYRASLMLWLSEGQDYSPWTAAECSDLQLTRPSRQEERRVKAFRNDPWGAHLANIDLLEETCVAEHKTNSWYSVETQLLHGNSPSHHIALFDKIRALENGPGQRMLVSKYPTILVSADMSRSTPLIIEMPEVSKPELLKILVDRQQNFRVNLSKYGERAVHSIRSLKRFIDPEFHHPLPVQERRDNVQGLIRFLEQYEKFHVGLLDEIEPEVEIAIKSTREAVIRGTARELSNHPQTVICGPSYMYWNDERAVLNFYLDFERLWAKLHEAGKTDRRRVIRKLRQVLNT